MSRFISVFNYSHYLLTIKTSYVNISALSHSCDTNLKNRRKKMESTDNKDLSKAEESPKRKEIDTSQYRCEECGSFILEKQDQACQDCRKYLGYLVGQRIELVYSILKEGKEAPPRPKTIPTFISLCSNKTCKSLYTFSINPCKRCKKQRNKVLFKMFLRWVRNIICFK